MSKTSARTRVAVESTRSSTIRLDRVVVDIKGELFRAVLLFSIMLGLVMLATLLIFVAIRG